MARLARILTLGVAALVVPAAIIVPNVPKALAATCSGTGCDGKDPVATGCNSGTITAESAPIKIGSTVVATIQLRYNPTCRTAWGRIIVPTAYWYGNGNYTGNVSRNSDNKTEQCNTLSYSSTVGGYTCYSPMLYDGGVTSWAFGFVYHNGTDYLGETASY